MEGGVVLQLNIKNDEEILKKDIYWWIIMLKSGSCIAGGRGPRIDIFPLWEAISASTEATMEDYEIAKREHHFPTFPGLP